MNIIARFFKTGLVALAMGLAILSPVMAQDLLSPAGRPDRPVGAMDAPVTLIEYSSPTCGHCVAYHREVAPLVRANYVDTGKVRLLFRPMTRNAIDAAIFMLTEAQPGERYQAVLDAFYARHEDIAAAADIKALLAEIAAEQGIDQSRFDAILADETGFNPLQLLASQAVDEFGLEGTPTFFINGAKLVGSIGTESVAAAIDAALLARNAAPKS